LQDASDAGRYCDGRLPPSPEVGMIDAGGLINLEQALASVFSNIPSSLPLLHTLLGCYIALRFFKRQGDGNSFKISGDYYSQGAVMCINLPARGSVWEHNAFCVRNRDRCFRTGRVSTS
jgi:hypothetical protein